MLYESNHDVALHKAASNIQLTQDARWWAAT